MSSSQSWWRAIVWANTCDANCYYMLHCKELLTLNEIIYHFATFHPLSKFNNWNLIEVAANEIPKLKSNSSNLEKTK